MQEGHPHPKELSRAIERLLFLVPRTPQMGLETGMPKCYTSSWCEIRSNPRPRGWIRPRGRGREPFRTINYTSHSVAAWHEPGSASLSSATDHGLPGGWRAPLTGNRAGCWGMGKRPGKGCAGHCAPAASPGSTGHHRRNARPDRGSGAVPAGRVGCQHHRSYAPRQVHYDPQALRVIRGVGDLLQSSRGRGAQPAASAGQRRWTGRRDENG
jgi:hypothetical protein